MTSATNPRQIAARKELAKADALGESLVIKSIMATVHGRRWMWLQISKGSIFEANLDLDPYRMAAEKGARNVCMALLKSILLHAPDLYIRMTNENSSAQLKEEPDGGHADDTDD